MFEELRKRSILTQEQLAVKIGVSQNTISNWENGKAKPDIPKIMKLSEILNCSIEEVVACFTEK